MHVDVFQYNAGMRKKQLSGYTILQSSIRQWATVRDWPWFKLLADVKNEKMGAAREAEERRQREEEERLKSEAEKAEKARRAIEEEKQRIIAEKQAMINQLANAATNLKDAEVGW
jgi:septin family protein